MKTQIKLSKKYEISFCIIKKQKFIFVNYENITSFFYIPVSVNFTKTSSELIFSNCEKKFSLLITEWFKRFERPARKKLIFVGLGLKASLDEKLKILHLKLEYSHSTLLKIPYNINVSIKKNILTLESFDPISLGNFIYKVRILRLPNAYKGKGICFKHSTQILKQIKKNK